MSKILLFIPMYNCQDQITRVLDSLEDVLSHVDLVLMIDNNSTDNTVENAKNTSKKLKSNVLMLQNDQNYGLGGSIKNALLFAIKNKYTNLIVLHGDDQANINDLKKAVLDNNKYQDFDLNIGARFHPASKLQGYSKFRIFGNKVFNILFGIVVKKRIYDMIAGLNCYKIDFFKSKFFLMFPNDLTFDAHLLLYACDNKAKINYFPVVWKEDDQISNARVFNQAKTILTLLVSYIFIKNKVFKKKCEMNEADYTYKILYDSKL